MVIPFDVDGTLIDHDAAEAITVTVDGLPIEVEGKKSDIEMLVIDRVEKAPTEN
jgi:hypothetical protein